MHCKCPVIRKRLTPIGTIFRCCRVYLENKILENDNTGIINALFNGLKYDTHGHFAHCSYYLFYFILFLFFYAKEARVLYVNQPFTLA